MCARQSGVSISCRQAIVWICGGGLSRLEEKHSAVGDTVCVAEIVDGRQQIDGGAGVSEPENRLIARKRSVGGRNLRVFAAFFVKSNYFKLANRCTIF